MFATRISKCVVFKKRLVYCWQWHKIWKWRSLTALTLTVKFQDDDAEWHRLKMNEPNLPPSRPVSWIGRCPLCTSWAQDWIIKKNFVHLLLRLEGDNKASFYLWSKPIEIQIFFCDYDSLAFSCWLSNCSNPKKVVIHGQWEWTCDWTHAVCSCYYNSVKGLHFLKLKRNGVSILANCNLLDSVFVTSVSQ